MENKHLADDAKVVEQCSANEIWQLNETKKYMLLATDLFHHLLADQSISSGAACLWQLLYSKATFDKELKISISYKQIANSLGKSTRTIMRYANTLENKGYLTISINFNEKIQQANTFYLRVPKNLIETLKLTKNRAKRVGEYEGEGQASPPLSTNQNLENIGVFLDEYKNNALNKEGDKGGKENINSSSRLTEQEPVTPETDSTVTPLGDKDVTQNTSVSSTITELNTNNNKTVVDSEIDNTILKMQQQLEKTKNALSNAKKEFAESAKKRVSLHEQHEKLNEIGRLESTLNILQNQFQNLQNESVKIRQEENITKIIENDAEFIFKKVGQRSIPQFTFMRLLRELENLGFTSNEKNKIANEIICEVRFGSLVRSNQSSQELTVDKAINIALKLVREKRWGQPANIDQIISSKQLMKEVCNG